MTKTLVNILNGSAGHPLRVVPALSESARSFWPLANHQILWGWKRDSDGHSRIVYFSGKLALEDDGVYVKDRFFYYRHRTDLAAARDHYSRFQRCAAALRFMGDFPHLSIERDGAYAVVRFAFGAASAEDRDRITRLLQRRPRKVWTKGEMPEAISDISVATESFPVDAYLGSGVSYECGLPTLCEVHDYFCLDDHREGKFTFSSADELPRWFENDPAGTIRNFCKLGVMALSAPASRAQRIVAQLYRKGAIRQIFSDNVDNMLVKVDVPFSRTRGSGVFNERFPAEFRTGTLLVVGVAADRRQIIAQARQKGMRIVVVDPCGKVSHGVQHLNYMKATDIFYRWTADEFFTNCQHVGEEHEDRRLEHADD